jgi:hypothetical protein
MLGISRVAAQLVASRVVFNFIGLYNSIRHIPASRIKFIELVRSEKNPSNGSPFQTSQNCCSILLMVIRMAGESMSLQAMYITYDPNHSWS